MKKKLRMNLRAGFADVVVAIVAILRVHYLKGFLGRSVKILANVINVLPKKLILARTLGLYHREPKSVLQLIAPWSCHEKFVDWYTDRHRCCICATIHNCRPCSPHYQAIAS